MSEVLKTGQLRGQKKQKHIRTKEDWKEDNDEKLHVQCTSERIC